MVQLEAELASPTNPDSLAVELAEVRAQLEVASAALRAEKNRSMKNEGRAERVAKLERDLDEMVAARARHTATTLAVGSVRWGYHRVRGARGIRQVSSIDVMTKATRATYLSIHLLYVLRLYVTPLRRLARHRYDGVLARPYATLRRRFAQKFPADFQRLSVRTHVQTIHRAHDARAYLKQGFVVDESRLADDAHARTSSNGAIERAVLVSAHGAEVNVDAYVASTRRTLRRRSQRSALGVGIKTR